MSIYNKIREIVDNDLKLLDIVNVIDDRIIDVISDIEHIVSYITENEEQVDELKEVVKKLICIKNELL